LSLDTGLWIGSLIPFELSYDPVPVAMAKLLEKYKSFFNDYEARCGLFTMRII
jgi:hypothetical protein